MPKAELVVPRRRLWLLRAGEAFVRIGRVVLVVWGALLALAVLYFVGGIALALLR